MLISTAVAYTRDYIVPTLDKRAPTTNEAEALRMPRDGASLRAEAQARVAATLGSAIGEAGPRWKWSEHPLTAAGLTGPLAPLALDALHLHALCLSLQAAAAAGGGGDVVGR